MRPKKDFSAAEYNKVSAVIKEVGRVDPATKNIMENPDNLDTTIGMIAGKRYQQYKKKFGSAAVLGLLNYHIAKEEYEICAAIKKATE